MNPPIPGFDGKGPLITQLSGLNEDLAGAQANQPLCRVERHINGSVGVELNLAAIRQCQLATLANAGFIVGPDISEGSVLLNIPANEPRSRCEQQQFQHLAALLTGI